MRDKLREFTDGLPDRRFLILLGILAVATYLRFRYAFFEGMWIDEGRYSRIGKEVSRHLLDYSVTTEWRGQITGFPPVYPYLIAIANLVFPPEFAARIISPITSVAGIAATYIFGREVADRETGLVAAALLSVNPIFWFLSERILIGATLTTMFTATVLAFWYGLEDRKYSRYALLATGPLTLLTILTKQPGYALGVILPAYLIYKKQDEIRDAWDRRSIRDSELYEVITNRDYYLSAALGIILIFPWMLRNMKACGFPLCSFQRALMFAGKDISSGWVQSHAQGLFFFIKSLPSQLTIIVAGFIVGKLVYNILKDYESTKKGTVYRIMAYTFSAGFLMIFYQKLAPMALLSGLALFGRSDFEKLAWIWIGVGIGFMSIPPVKDPRYIVFTIPALVLLASISIRDFGRWAGNLAEFEYASPLITAVIVFAAVFMSYSSGIGNVERGGYNSLEPAGEWVSENVPKDSNVAASSVGQMRFYSHPRNAYMPIDNKSSFTDFISRKNISHVVLDTYEPAQPHWAQMKAAPYRVPFSVKRKLRSGSISKQEVGSMFEKTPGYLDPVKTFGNTRSPVSRQSQPRVIIYRVNKSAIK